MEEKNNKQEELEEKFDFAIWKKIFKEYSEYKYTFAMILFINVVTAITTLGYPLMSQFVIDNFVTKKDLSALIPIIIIAVLLAIVAGLCAFFIIKLSGFMQEKSCDKLRKKCFAKLQELSLSFYDENSVGSLMSRMTSDINRLSGILIWGLGEGSVSISLIIFIIIAMLNSHLKMGLFVCIVFPLIFLLIKSLFKKMLRLNRAVRKINGEITGAYNEDIQGVKTTKTLVCEEINFKEFSALTYKMKQQSIRSIAVSAGIGPIGSIFLALIQGAVIAYGGSQVLSEAISLGLLSAFIAYIIRLNYPLFDSAYMITEIISAQAVAERIFTLLDTQTTIKEKESVLKEWGTSLNPTEKKCPPIKGDVEFESVSFFYKEDEPVLSDFNLTVKAGETIALVGATGSGKSTIVNLFCRFYEPTSGRILIDGIDYTEMPERWVHENLGYVLQSPHLFSGTIMENIRNGKPDASDEEIYEAAKLADAHSFISGLSEGYNTEVGEGGSLLSSGQKQLISFARAIIRNPRLFVLDEATSSIDTQAEQKIQHSIERLLKGRTSFVIAHRLSTIRNADKILLIDSGKIIESGTHTDLLAKKEKYYSLYMKQFIEESEKAIEVL